RVVVTAEPGVNVGTMRETCPSIDGSWYGMLPGLASGAGAVAASVKIGTPCGASAAPWRKSICPPTPLYCLVPIDSEQTCPVRSTSRALLMTVAQLDASGLGGALRAP